MAERLRVLAAVAAQGISIDFLKLTPSGLSFLVPEQDANVVEGALQPLSHHFSVRHDRSIVLVHAVSIRDEEGLIARIVHTAIANGIRIDHIGDMHDRMLLVVQKEDATRLASSIQESETQAEIAMGAADAH
jgi:aspartate kinase